MKIAMCCLVPILALGLPVLAQTGHRGLLLDKNPVFPYFAVGLGYSTSLLIINPGSVASVSGTLHFFNADGTPMTVLYLAQPVTEIPINLAPGASIVLPVTPAAAGLQVGWALYESQRPPGHLVHGSEIFLHLEGGVLDTKAGIQAPNYAMGAFKGIALPVLADPTTSGNTGLAVANTGSNPLNIVFMLKDSAGNVVRPDATIDPPVGPLEPGEQFVRFVTDLYPDVNFDDFEGTLEMTTDQEGMVATGLLTQGTVLTAIPVVTFNPVVPQTVTVTNAGFAFSPSLLTINAGDTVRWTINSIHNVVEVSQATWNANGNTSNGGFSLPFGGGTHTFSTPGTYYYVCEPHASGGMKGRVIVD